MRSHHSEVFSALLHHLCSSRSNGSHDIDNNSSADCLACSPRRTLGCKSQYQDRPDAYRLQQFHSSPRRRSGHHPLQLQEKRNILRRPHHSCFRQRKPSYCSRILRYYTSNTPRLPGTGDPVSPGNPLNIKTSTPRHRSRSKNPRSTWLNRQQRIKT
jgi:hypothetical protein